MLASLSSQHLESELRPLGNPLHDSANHDRALGRRHYQVGGDQPVDNVICWLFELRLLGQKIGRESGSQS
jgi:hypothetical protein